MRLNSRCDHPASIVRAPEQSGETGGRVEPRHAEPVDGTVYPDQRRGLHIADERVILDPQRHETSPQLKIRTSNTHLRPSRRLLINAARGARPRTPRVSSAPSSPR